MPFHPRFRRTLAFRLWLGANLSAKVASLPFFFSGRPGLATLVALLDAPWLVWQHFAPRARGLGPSVQTFSTTQNELWLTLDDGPDPATTPAALALLAQHDARATFFVIGEKARRHPDLVRAILAAGHTIGNHTDTHRLATFWCLPPVQLRQEIDRAQNAVRAIAPSATPIFFRPPAGQKNLFLHAALHARDLRLVHWSARAFDTRCRDVATALRRLASQLRPGAIVLLHESGPKPALRIKILAAVLAQLRAKNLRCVLPPSAALIDRSLRLNAPASPAPPLRS